MQPATKQSVFKLCTLALLPIALSGCLGGSIAQQLASSILMHGADQATAAMLDVQDSQDNTITHNSITSRMALKDTAKNTYPNDLQIALLTSGFEPAQAPQAQIEPLPPVKFEEDIPIQYMQESKLVSVEVWNLLIGDEKQRLLEKARLQGSLIIPPKDEWPYWQIAVGAQEPQLNGNRSQVVTFLIPPEIGKIPSGAKALVELPPAGELSIARYPLN